MSLSTTTYSLYGGALTVSLPSGLIDASDLRQIPDTQEVFLSPDSDVTYIVEILEKVDPTDLTEAAKFHFDSIAHDNSAESTAVQRVVVLETPTIFNATEYQQQPTPVVLIGTQLVNKFNRPALDEVLILLALFRVPNRNSDVVLSVNVPIASRNPETHVVTSEIRAAVETAFETAARSFRVMDFGLFAA